jgi:hypothetical protein
MNTWVGRATQGQALALSLSEERWGRVFLHFVAALRAGHWSWHFAGIGREMECIWPQARRVLVTANGWPAPNNNERQNQYERKNLCGLPVRAGQRTNHWRQPPTA